MGKLLDSFMEYLKNTPKDQIMKEWESSQSWDDVGPTLNEFLELYDQFVYKPNCSPLESNINYEKSELSFGLFFSIFVK